MQAQTQLKADLETTSKVAALTRLSLVIPVRFDDDGLMLEDYVRALADVKAVDLSAACDQLRAEWSEDRFPLPAVIRRYAIRARQERLEREDALRPKLVVIPDPDEPMRGQIARRYFCGNFVRTSRLNKIAAAKGDPPVTFEYTQAGMFECARKEFKVAEAFIDRWKKAIAEEDGGGKKA